MQEDPWGNRVREPKGDAFKEIAKGIQSIQQNANELQSLADNLGTARDTPKLRREITQLRNDAANTIQDVKAYLESVRNDDRVKFEKLANQFKNVISEYQKAADLSLKKEKDIHDLMQQTLEAENADVERPKRSNTYRFTLSDMGVSDVDRKIVEEQNQEIKSIENDLVQLHEVFRDMATLVEEAQPQLDDIENKIQTTQDNTERAVDDLQKASVFACQARWKRLWIAILCAVILLIIIAVIVVVVVVLVKK